MANDGENNGASSMAGAALVFFCLLPLLAVVGAVAAIVVTYFWLVSLFVLGPLKKTITRQINVEGHSAYWPYMHYLYLPVMAAAFIFTGYAVYVVVNDY